MKKDPEKDPCQSFVKTYKMTIDPVKRVGFIVMLLNILLLALVLASIFDNQKQTIFLLSILFLQCSMVMVYAALKYIQKRIDALEEKLSNQNQPKE